MIDDAKKRLANKVTNIVIGIYAKNFHVTPGKSNKGINTIIFAIDEEIFGPA